MNRHFFTGCMLLLCAACSTGQGLHPESLHEILRQDAALFEGPAAATSMRDAPPRHSPSTVALYVKPTGFLKRGFEWSGQDRDRILAWAKTLISRGLIAEVKIVSPASLKGAGLGELRRAAERYGADMVLVLDGAAAVDRHNNYKAPLLYWTIVGAYLVDGTQSDALCLIEATLWDVKTGHRLFSETAEGQASLVGPAALVDDNAVLAEAKQRAVDALTPRIEDGLQRAREAR